MSCDLNYRKKLWTRDEARETMTKLMRYVDVCISNEEDAKDVFGIEAENTDIESGKLNMVLDAYVPKWSPAEAKKLVKESVAANGNRIDAIFASNDRLAGAAAEALKELHVTNHAVITGMDAELSAIKRILAGTQDATIYMDLRELAYAAVDEAYNLATKKKVNVNSELGSDGSNKINAFLINGKVVTRENINKVLIEPGHFTKEDIYSE